MTGIIAFLRDRSAELQLAIMLLTRLPVGRIADPVPPISAVAWAFPVAGLIVGTMAAMVFYGALHLGLPPQIAAGLALAAGVLATGCLHEDGLADVADGFGGGRDLEHKLAIMRDSHIGSYGTLALVLVLGLRWQAMAALGDVTALQAAFALLAIAVASRAVLPVALLTMPAARPDGLGRSASGASAIQAAVAVTLGAGALVLLLGGAAALAVGLAITAAALLVAALALRQIGGQTGDVLGLMQQTADVCGWITLVGLL